MMREFKIRGDTNTTEFFLVKDEESGGVVLKASVGGEDYFLMTIIPSGHILVHSLEVSELHDLGLFPANVEGRIGFPSMLDDENEQLFVLERTLE